jgi:predicted DCC family thiol-disulfide oxidoreductase YuxK
VGKHRWLAILRWPVIRHIADLCYLFFARHRQKISGLLMRQHTQASSGQTSCSETSCRQCR